MQHSTSAPRFFPDWTIAIGQIGQQWAIPLQYVIITVWFFSAGQFHNAHLFRAHDSPVFQVHSNLTHVASKKCIFWSRFRIQFRLMVLAGKKKLLRFESVVALSTSARCSTGSDDFTKTTIVWAHNVHDYTATVLTVVFGSRRSTSATDA